MSKVKLSIIIALLLMFCFVPLVNMPYQVIVEEEVTETYTVKEPYTVREEVREPITTYSYVWHEYLIPEDKGFGEYEYGHWVKEPTTTYRTTYKDVIEYREVIKTRLVSRPVVKTRTKRVSILRYLLR